MAEVSPESKKDRGRSFACGRKRLPAEVSLVGEKRSRAEVSLDSKIAKVYFLIPSEIENDFHFQTTSKLFHLIRDSHQGKKLCGDGLSDGQRRPRFSEWRRC